MALLTRLEQFFEGLPSLISQAGRELHSDTINILEHFGRRLQDAFDVLNIFKSGCEDVLASRELINITSDVISQTEINRTDDALLTDREYVMQLLEASQLACMKLFTISPVTWGDRDVTLRKKNSIDYLISTIPGQKLHQHLVFKKEN